MKYLIIKKVSNVFTFTESSNGTLEDGVIYGGNTLAISGYNNEVYTDSYGNKNSYLIADVKYKNVSYASFTLLFSELVTDGFTGNFKSTGEAVQLKDFYVDANNAGTTETDLYTYTTAANRLKNAGEKIIAIYGGSFNDITATSQLKIYFSGVLIGNTGALTINSVIDFKISLSLIRTGASTARSILNIATRGASTPSYSEYTALTGLDFSNTNILKITGTAGGATGGSNDITTTYGNIIWQPAAL